MSITTHESTTPTEAESLLARESLRRLNSVLSGGDSAVRIHLHADEGPGEDLALPSSVLSLLKRILEETAKGRAVKLMPVQAELTTQQAADLLNVSRPFLIDLLEAGGIPFRRVGRHRRVRLDDLRIYKENDDLARRRIADDLAAEAQELGLGY